jgi:hypothetical protein
MMFMALQMLMGGLMLLALAISSRRFDALATECAGSHRSVLSYFLQFLPRLHRLRLVEFERRSGGHHRPTAM